MTTSTITLLPHQQRVVEELGQCAERLEKLHAFITVSSAFTTLDAAEQARLRRQANIMGLYKDVLQERIDNFSV